MEIDRKHTHNILCEIFFLFLSEKIWLYSEFTDKVERNCHFSAPGWNCMIRSQALQGFPDTSRQESLHENSQINSFFF
jgi:hypothetical protein